jgi:predicted HTH transcriptional regulator
MKKGFAVVFYRPADHTNVDDEQVNETSAAFGAARDVSLNVRINDEDVQINYGNVQTNDEDVQINDENVQINHGNVQINVQINDMERRVLTIIAERPNLTLNEIAMQISRTAKTAQRYLEKLRSKSIINRVGSKKDGYWEIIAPVGKKDRS